MKRFHLTFMVFALLLLSAPLAWGCSGNTDCNERDPNEKKLQLVPVDQPASQQSKGKFRTRSPAAAEDPVPGWYNVGQRRLFVEVPRDWEVLEGMFGVDLSVMGPGEDGDRAILSISDLGESSEFNLKNPKQEEKDYRKGREEWLKKKDGKFLKLFPLHNVSLAGAKGFTVGYRYAIMGSEFLENTYYVVCKGNGYHLQSLVPAALEDTSAQAMEKIVAGFTCTGTE